MRLGNKSGIPLSGRIFPTMSGCYNYMQYIACCHSLS